jgi:putative ABC transport system permease protein
MGATNNNILVQFLSEAVAISIIGGSTGIILVKLITVALSSYLPVEFNLLLIFYTFMVCVFIGVSAGMIPARTAANLNPIDALRHE